MVLEHVPSKAPERSGLGGLRSWYASSGAGSGRECARFQVQSQVPNKVLEGSGVGILVVPVYVPEQLPGKIPQRVGFEKVPVLVGGSGASKVPEASGRLSRGD